MHIFFMINYLMCIRRLSVLYSSLKTIPYIYQTHTICHAVYLFHSIVCKIYLHYTLHGICYVIYKFLCYAFYVMFHAVDIPINSCNLLYVRCIVSSHYSCFLSKQIHYVMY